MFSPIHHDLEGIAADRFRSLASQLKRLQQQHAPAERLDALCHNELAWIVSTNGLNSSYKKYEACVRLLVDLAKLRWRIVQDGFGIELSTPATHSFKFPEISSYKEIVRQELKSQIHLQFESKTVRDFIRRMEMPTPTGKKQPVTELIADGRELNSRLLEAREICDEDRRKLCKAAIQPYLQLVETGSTDSFTGLKLSDIWRYFRYTWAIPATSIPGRNLFYLVRDAAHPKHAVMGITALSNAPLSLRARDDLIGWTATATQEKVKRFSRLPENECISELTYLFNMLEANLEQGISSIAHSGLLQVEEADNPTEAVIQRLRRRAAEFANRRENILRDSELPLTINELEDIKYGDPDVSNAVLALETKIYKNDRMNAARRALIVKKRAAELARLLQAKATFIKYRARLLIPSEAAKAYEIKEVSTAVNASWISAKNARAGTSMLEITVCGAIRPYNYLLGGKLSALLMLSPEVADDYTRRYGNATSIISSMMKNEPIVKDSRLVFLGTTSLYLHGSSQYNRLRLPAGIISSEQQEIRYAHMGETGGFGTVQFSADTVKAIEYVVTEEKGYRQVNSIFGEGRSPKLRKLRAGLDMLGFDPNMLLQHHQPRLIYGAMLYSQACDFLQAGDNQMPDFIQRPQDFRDATQRISDFWVERWLSKRLDHSPVFDDLMRCTAWKLSQSVPVAGLPTNEVAPSQISVQALPPTPSSVGEVGLSLWKSLAAAGHDSCSDCVNDTDLDRLHVPSPLEDFLLEKVKQGFSILLTGNAGDGKTHLLRRLAPALEQANALVDLDATASMRKGSVAPILDQWRSALNANRPYCLAANEYPLHLLIRESKEFLPDPLYAELKRQTSNRLAYSEQPKSDEAAQENLLVVDLSLRNPLTRSFSLAALRRMLNDPAIVAYADLGMDPDFSWNHIRLSVPQIQERLIALFQRLENQGKRCTIRELWILLARLMFGDPIDSEKNSEGSPSLWYSTRLWSMENGGERIRLLRLLNEYVDPAVCSHPHWDWKLEYSTEMDSSMWYNDIPKLDLSCKDRKIALSRFAALKRRFYFEHTHGAEIFALIPGYREEFSSLLDGASTADDVFKGDILRAINHTYCPQSFTGNERELYLWFSHRYHEQPTRAYLANRFIPVSDFQILVPRLPERLCRAFDYNPDHLRLNCTNGDQDIWLRIDASLYAVLKQLATGFPRHLMPESELNKLDDFLSRLQIVNIVQSRKFYIYNTQSRLATCITLGKDFKKYAEVELL